MPSDRTRRFARLLRTQQQLERGVEWRYAEAKGRRLNAERERDRIEQEINESLVRHAQTVSSSCTAAFVLSGYATEAAARRRLAEQQAKVAECRRVEADVETVLRAMRVKTKQWEKLHENAASVDAEEDLQGLQRSWDEHGIRSHTSAASGGAEIES
jgi:hypothetical protein